MFGWPDPPAQTETRDGFADPNQRRCKTGQPRQRWHSLITQTHQHICEQQRDDPHSKQVTRPGETHPVLLSHRIDPAGPAAKRLRGNAFAGVSSVMSAAASWRLSHRPMIRG